MRAVGGRVLKRATLAALNRVPGRVGRYNITLMGPDIVMLSEFLPSGQAPIALFAPGLVYFAAYGGLAGATRGGGRAAWTGGCPSVPEVRAGFPFKRQVAVLGMLCETAPDVRWRPEYETGAVGGALMGGTCWAFLRPGQEPPRRGYYSGTGGFIGLNEEVAGTYCGSRPTAIGAIPDMLYDAGAALEEWQSRARSGSAQAVRGAWARLVSCCAPRTEGSPPDSLAEVGLEPEVWSSQTDPGGDGDPCGADDGDRASEDDDYDTDYEPPRPRRVRGRPAHTVRGPASSFAEWEDRQIAAGMLREVPRVMLRRSDVVPQYDPAIEGCGCEQCVANRARVAQDSTREPISATPRVRRSAARLTEVAQQPRINEPGELFRALTAGDPEGSWEAEHDFARNAERVTFRPRDGSPPVRYTMPRDVILGPGGLDDVRRMVGSVRREYHWRRSAQRLAARVDTDIMQAIAAMPEGGAVSDDLPDTVGYALPPSPGSGENTT